MDLLLHLTIPVFLNGLALAVVWGKLTEKVKTHETTINSLTTRLAVSESELSKQRDDFSRLSVALWGIDGQNGLRGHLKELTTKTDELKLEVGNLTSELRDNKLSNRELENKLTQILERIDKGQ